MRSYSRQRSIGDQWAVWSLAAAAVIRVQLCEVRSHSAGLWQRCFPVPLSSARPQFAGGSAVAAGARHGGESFGRGGDAELIGQVHGDRASSRERLLGVVEVSAIAAGHAGRVVQMHLQPAIAELTSELEGVPAPASGLVELARCRQSLSEALLSPSWRHSATPRAA